MEPRLSEQQMKWMSVMEKCLAAPEPAFKHSSRSRSGDTPWPEGFGFLVVSLSISILYTDYIRNALRRFLQIWYNCSVGPKEELIRFWWSKVKVTVTSQSSALPCEHNISGMPPGSSFKVGTSVQLDSSVNWFDLDSKRSTVKFTVFSHNTDILRPVWREYFQIYTSCLSLDEKCTDSISGAKGQGDLKWVWRKIYLEWNCTGWQGHTTTGWWI